MSDQETYSFSYLTPSWSKFTEKSWGKGGVKQLVMMKHKTKWNEDIFCAFLQCQHFFDLFASFVLLLQKHTFCWQYIRRDSSWKYGQQQKVGLCKGRQRVARMTEKSTIGCNYKYDSNDGNFDDNDNKKHTNIISFE